MTATQIKYPLKTTIKSGKLEKTFLTNLLFAAVFNFWRSVIAVQGRNPKTPEKVFASNFIH
jgi:hypothetical protein